MRTILTVLTALFLVTACDFRASVNFSAGGKTLESRGVKFLVPIENSSSMEGDLGFKFDGETVKAETKGDRLLVGGVDYGTVARGDVVNLTSPGKVVINGAERQPAPAATNARMQASPAAN